MKPISYLTSLNGTYDRDTLMKLTGASIRTIQSWATKGYLEKIKHNPITYRVLLGQDEEEQEVTEVQSPMTPDPSLLVFSTDADNTVVADYLSEVEDITLEVESAGSVMDYLEAVNAAKKQVKLVHPVTGRADTKILVLSDMHIPFHNEELIEKALADHADADILVANGDIMDMYAASSYSKNKHADVHVEYSITLDYVRRWSQSFDEVVLTKGNHEDRVDRYFTNKVDPNLNMLLRKDVMSQIARGIIYNKNGEVLGRYPLENVRYADGLPGWMAKVGKAIFMHPHTYASSVGGTVKACLDFIQPFFNYNDYDTIVIGHTHKAFKAVEKDKLLIEGGHLAKVPDYLKNGKLIRRPQVSGYSVIYQDQDGNTDFNRSGFIYCGTLNLIG